MTLHASCSRDPLVTLAMSTQALQRTHRPVHIIMLFAVNKICIKKIYKVRTIKYVSSKIPRLSDMICVIWYTTYYARA